MLNRENILQLAMMILGALIVIKGVGALGLYNFAYHNDFVCNNILFIDDKTTIETEKGTVTLVTPISERCSDTFYNYLQRLEYLLNLVIGFWLFRVAQTKRIMWAVFGLVSAYWSVGLFLAISVLTRLEALQAHSETEPSQ